MTKRNRRREKNRVHVAIRAGRLRLRWSCLGQRWEIYLSLPDSPKNRDGARTLAIEIEKDIADRQFDQTLEKYRPKLEPTPDPAKAPTTTEGWEQWMKQQREDGVAPQTLANRYQSIANLLSKFGRDIQSVDDARQFIDYLRSRQSASTSNRNLKMLLTFGNWCVSNGWWESNPFTQIKPAKVSNRERQGRTPFTPSEIKKILMAFKFHPEYCCYHDFVLTLLALGLRPSEAIGLQWRNINFTRQEITIAESLPRSGEGSRRVRKDRKNGVVTVLDLPDNIITMLQGRFTPDTRPDDLVFPSPKGNPIDDHNFSQRVWRSVLKTAEVDHRPPYNCRHTMASLAIDQGATLTDAAYLMGHRNNRMVSTVYGHVMSRPQLPKLTP